jgi:chromosome segregation ATPase
LGLQKKEPEKYKNLKTEREEKESLLWAEKINQASQCHQIRSLWSLDLATTRPFTAAVTLHI